MIEFKNVSKVYDNGSVALDDVCLTINEGEFVLICGHSGAGDQLYLEHNNDPKHAVVTVTKPERVMVID